MSVNKQYLEGISTNCGNGCFPVIRLNVYIQAFDTYLRKNH